ncbi:EAL domain-containing protein [Inquilinus sp. CAU 1745]|uniref:EAL domain-containing protein n=1 Tax=Inquilinus sp. CAU 1745 TaxID=3140369 RepID=UPI00325BC845
MPLIRHVLIAFIYGALAIAAALGLPHLGIERWMSVAIGALTLIFGAVLHEVHARQERETALKRELKELADARDSVLEELARARAEVRAIHGELLEQPRRDDKRDDTLDVMKEEVRMLQQMVGRMSGRRVTPIDTAAPPPRIIDVAEMGEEAAIELIEEAVRADRVEMGLAPIVSLPQRKPRHFRAFSQIRTPDGGMLTPHLAPGLADRPALMASIDNILLFRCVQMVRDRLRRQRSVGFFAAVAHRTLRDADFMAQFVEFAHLNPELPSRVVLELNASEVRDDGAAARDPIATLGALGFRFCLTGLDRLDRISADVLEASHVRFLKIDARTLLRGTAGNAGREALRDLKDSLDRSAIDLIVEGIDSEAVLVEVLDLPIDYGQGPLFGDARLG